MGCELNAAFANLVTFTPTKKKNMVIRSDTDKLNLPMLFMVRDL